MKQQLKENQKLNYSSSIVSKISNTNGDNLNSRRSKFTNDPIFSKNNYASNNSNNNNKNQIIIVDSDSSINSDRRNQLSSCKNSRKGGHHPHQVDQLENLDLRINLEHKAENGQPQDHLFALEAGLNPQASKGQYAQLSPMPNGDGTGLPDQRQAGVPNSSYDYQMALEPHGPQPGKVTRSSGGQKADSEGRTTGVASRGAYQFAEESSSLIREEGDNSSRAAITNNSESKDVSKD